MPKRALSFVPKMSRAAGVVSLAGVALVVAGVAVAVSTCWAQPAPSSALPAAPKSALPGQPVVRPVAKPAWSELQPMQQRALKPLAGTWNSISEPQKRKWLAISRNFDKLPPAEQATLHARMGEWVGLSATQRSQARLNFAETKQLSADEKQAKWQAYQALSAEEKQKLAEGGPRRLTGAATAVKPVPKQRLATIPTDVQHAPNVPKIATAPHQVDQNTLLPQVAGPETSLAAPQSH